MSSPTLDLSDADIDDMIGDGASTHLPQVRMALEIKRRRAASADLKAAVDHHLDIAFLRIAAAIDGAPA